MCAAGSIVKYTEIFTQKQKKKARGKSCWNLFMYINPWRRKTIKEINILVYQQKKNYHQYISHSISCSPWMQMWVRCRSFTNACWLQWKPRAVIFPFSSALCAYQKKLRKNILNWNILNIMKAIWFSHSSHFFLLHCVLKWYIGLVLFAK